MLLSNANRYLYNKFRNILAKNKYLSLRKRPDAFIDDFNTDFNMDLITTDLFGPKVQVHRGFFERYKLIRNEILKVISLYGNKEDFYYKGTYSYSGINLNPTKEKILLGWSFAWSSNVYFYMFGIKTSKFGFECICICTTENWTK